MKYSIPCGLGLLLWTMVPSTNAALPEECPKLFELFNLTTTYEDAGKVAEKMYNTQCWPALQGAPTEQASQLPPIEDCDSLSKHIIQMSVDQATDGSPVILRLYEVNFLTQATYDKVIHHRVVVQRYRIQDASPFNKTPKGTERVLNCTAKARYTQGPTELIQMYFDRDPDGQEFIGMAGLMVL